MSISQSSARSDYRRIMLALALALALALPACGLAQNADPSIGNYAGKILNRAVTDSHVTDRNADSKLDVRDLAIYINSLPISATFESAESLAYFSQGSITLTIKFSKPVTGTIKFDLGGNAGAGVGLDYLLSPTQIPVTNASSTQITLLFQPWRGMGGEKVIRLSLSRSSSIIPANGAYPSHLVRIRQFEQGEYVGMLTFPAGSGLPSQSVRIGLNSGTGAVCSFQNESTLLGSQLSLTWGAKSSGFPNFTGTVALTISGTSLGRATPINASLVFTRKTPPYGAELDAYLAGFPANDQPALYTATFTFHDLIAAGQGKAVESNPFAVVHQGRLTLQPVTYAAVNP